MEVMWCCKSQGGEGTAGELAAGPDPAISLVSAFLGGSLCQEETDKVGAIKQTSVEANIFCDYRWTELRKCQDEADGHSSCILVKQIA